MTPADQHPSGGHRGGRGDRRSRPSYPPGGRDRGTSGPTRRPAPSRPPAEDPARQVALDVLRAVREDAAYANLVLPVLLRERGITGRDAALATELTYGTCRALGQLDAIASTCGNRSHAELDGVVVDALRLGGYQLLHTRIPPHAAVSATVDLVRAGPRPGAAGYVNAVLRRITEHDIDGWIARLTPPGTDPLAVLALRWAHPRWIVSAFADALATGSAGRPDTELEAALAADDAPPLTHLVARPGLIDRDELADMAGGVPARFSPYGVYSGGGNPGGMAAIADGRAAVQDEGSQLVALALATAPVDGPDTRWLDLAAGPGGKAALLAAIAAERGATLDAIEITPHRADLVRRTTRGLPVTVHTADGRDPGLPEGSFDRVLLDAPCTGLGALRRRPEARWRRQPADVGDLVRLQRELLAAAARMVRPGGLVAYVTCSPHLSETVGVTERAPAGLELVDARPYLPGVPDLGDGPTVQLWPHRHGTDAMFLALLRRR
ncbi:RsmB/NOP family class I SAM-dependent RNA methyltransferase [Nakamurella flava]|uniref:RsmB/NOP family class I SAM-dependent RNA methyltransferase n=1 Tax=Nakamurella flava TaxID=2576308 RepID=A0A4U6QFR3_9ACTN|nr:RsmB/NOP family class I SAM-dependent RNA methyltransferase [Nakamurella flava]TKV58928.1 RsmB/NOP family class I SAM-dependent RNA methyltransferase [Nakamurella flava]